MKKLLSVVLAVGLASICLLAGEQGATANNAVEWQMSVETAHGTMAGPVKMQQEGSKITGTFESDAGKTALTGKVEGNKLTFSMDAPGGMTLTFNGAVEGDKMSGTTDPVGRHKDGWPWSASRK